MTQWLDPDWPSPPGVRVISTLRQGGVSEGRYASFNLGDHVGDNAERVAENRNRLTLSALLPAEPTWLQQVHGVAVANLDQPDLALPADAAITRQPGRICAILTADCLPIMLSAVSGEVVAAAHAGWRGLAGGVLESTMKALGLPGEQVQAWLGPAIGVEHFEVGAEVREVFLVGNEAAETAFHPNARGRFMADLALLARLRLERLGVRRIYGGTLCTYADPQRFFSHRRDGTTGRQATLIWRESVENR
jgi:YfiH family protein